MVNLRGKVIPVVDLRIRFNMPVVETQDVCIIVVQVRGIQMGIVVDRVSEVVTVAADDIEPPPSFGVDVPTDFLLGIGKAQGRVKMLLEFDQATIATAGDDAAGATAAA